MSSYAPLLRRPSAKGAGRTSEGARAPIPGHLPPVPTSSGPMVVRRACGCASSPTSAQQACESCRERDAREGKEKQVRRAPLADGRAPGGGEPAPPLVHRVLSSTGRPLDPFVLQAMQQRLGRPLGEVRLHVDDTAARSASAIGAKAYTFGNHVVFGAGHYRP